MVLNMKTNDEIFELVISRRDEYNAEKRNRKNLLAAFAAVAVCLGIATGVAVNRIKPEKMLF